MRQGLFWFKENPASSVRSHGAGEGGRTPTPLRARASEARVSTKVPPPRQGSKRWCPGGESNPYALSGTSPSSWRVYQVPPPGQGVRDAEQVNVARDVSAVSTSSTISPLSGGEQDLNLHVPRDSGFSREPNVVGPASRGGEEGNRTLGPPFGGRLLSRQVRRTNIRLHSMFLIAARETGSSNNGSSPSPRRETGSRGRRTDGFPRHAMRMVGEEGIEPPKARRPPRLQRGVAYQQHTTLR